MRRAWRGLASHFGTEPGIASGSPPADASKAGSPEDAAVGTERFEEAASQAPEDLSTLRTSRRVVVALNQARRSGSRHDVLVPNAERPLSGDLPVEVDEDRTAAGTRLTEDDFWLHLEYRVSAEFGGFEQPELRRLWCDGFVPEDYVLGGSDPTIRGQAWIGLGRVRGGRGEGQEQWEFVLHLGPQATDRTSIDWSALLPPIDATSWLVPDPVNKRLDMEPSAAIPDQ